MNCQFVKRAVFKTLAACGIVALISSSPAMAAPHLKPPHFKPPPKNKNVTISNGGLSITFNIAWGAVVVGISNKNVAHGMNIVDYHDVGRELQVDQFLFWNRPGRQPLLVNPTQAGAEGYQAYYKHPHGISIPQVGSRVVKWKAGRHHFFAVIKPWDYDTGNPTHWVYIERVAIDRQGAAHFHYLFKRHGKGTFRMNSEIPTLYSDWTDTFMYPLVNPYIHNATTRRYRRSGHWPVRQVVGTSHWASTISKGWIANIDTRNNIGIFYTTPVGLREAMVCFPGAAVSDSLPLGKSNVAIGHVLCRPHEVYSVKFSVLVATPKAGPALISRQAPAQLKFGSKIWHRH